MAPHTQTPGWQPGARLESLEAIDCKEYSAPAFYRKWLRAEILGIGQDRALIAFDDRIAIVPLIRRRGCRPFVHRPRIREWIGDVRTWTPALLPRAELRRIAAAIEGGIA